MREELVGYVFGVLDLDTAGLVEQYLQANPAAHLSIERIRRSTIELLSWDGGHLPAPDGLAVRTVKRCLNGPAPSPQADGTAGSGGTAHSHFVTGPGPGFGS